MSKRFYSYFVAWVILFAATIAIAQLLPVEKGDLFNTVYYSIATAFVIELFIAFFTFGSGDKTISQSVFIFSIAGVLMIFAANYYLLFKQYYHKPWFYACVNIAVLALHYVFLIAMGASLGKNAERDKNQNKIVDVMRSITNEVKALYNSTNDEDINRLYETLRYSDKASKDSEIEEKILEEVNELKGITDKNRIKDKVDQIIKLVKSRV